MILGNEAMKFNLKVYFCVLLGTLGLSKVALADLYHYNNLLIGDRALGLGGAFTAIADDASGVYYNPAGLGFALNNDVSGSANAAFSKTTIYKDILPDRSPGTNYEETSKGSVAPFVGGLQKLDNIAKGLVFAFAIYNTNNELIVQKDTITAEPESSLNNGESSVGFQFLRNVQLKSEDFNVAVGFGYRLANSFSLGTSITLVTESELLQDYQHTGQIIRSDTNEDGQLTNADSYVYSQLDQNTRQEIFNNLIELSLGTQWVFASNFVFGIVAKYRQVVAQQFDYLANRTVGQASLGVTDCNSENLATCTDAVNDYKGRGDARALSTQYTRSEFEADDIFGNSQMRARLGLAYFPSPTLLMSFDVAYNGAVEKGESEKTEQNAFDFSKEANLDYHFGTEYYISPSFPLRFGLFTNNDTRPQFDEKEANQKDYIDYLGVTLFGSWVQPNSQLGLGVTYQMGEGKANKLGGTAVQEIESNSVVYALSAAHSF